MFISVLCGIIIVSLIVLLDQLSKLMAMVFLLDRVGQTIEIIPGFFRFSLSFNNGAAFSSFSGQFIVLMAMTVVATILFCYMARFANFKKAPWYSTGIYFMIGGMLGNFIDRAFSTERMYAPKHSVVDFLSFTFFGKYDFAIFNIADSFLVVGAILVVIDLLFFERKRSKVGNKDA